MQQKRSDLRLMRLNEKQKYYSVISYKTIIKKEFKIVYRKQLSFTQFICLFTFTVLNSYSVNPLK